MGKSEILISGTYKKYDYLVEIVRENEINLYKIYIKMEGITISLIRITTPHTKANLLKIVKENINKLKQYYTKE